MVIHYGYTDWQDGGNARLEVSGAGKDRGWTGTI